jgi:phage-related protein
VPWIVQYHEAARAEALQLAHDMQARLDRLLGLIAAYGLQQLPPKTVKHIDGDLWELRIKGKDGIARAFYVTRIGQRLVIVRVFVKKTQKTPPREIRLAQQRATEV